MKKFIWVAVALLLGAWSSQAQQISRGDVSAGYSFIRSGGVNLNGFNTTVAYHANDWFGVVGDVGVYHGSPAGVGVTAFTYTAGPRFSVHKSDKIVPFAQALVGGSHISASFGGFSGSTNPFAFILGGGADVALSGSGKVSLRPEFDYFGLRAGGATGNGLRISAAIVYHFGQR
jgi:opacity protein-like surface antigen